MPKTGVPADAGRTGTHTGTEQWQSFEIRMRHRRAERCRLRAEAALDAGLEAEARAALDEARSLEPATPSFDELLTAARARRKAADAGRSRQLSRRGAVVIAAGLIAILGLGWAVFETRETAEVEMAASTGPVPPPPAQAATGGRLPEEVETPRKPATAETPAAAPDARIDIEPAREAAPRRAVPTPLPRERAPQRRAVEPPAASAVPVSTAGTAVPETPPPTTTATIQRPPVDASLPAAALGAPATAAMNVPAPPAKPAPAPEAVDPPAAEPASQEPAVRSVLARFEAAYSSLSASAARQVWPSVDARSLSRAFEGLESQRVSLGNCRVQVAASTARAECSGSATWTPKIGGGRRTEPRRWEFDLARDNGAWVIVQARAR